MTEPKSSIFSDRRRGRDRRSQNLPMPSGLDRRRGGRRNRHFDAKPWWLRTNYAAELISESTIIESGLDDQTEKSEGTPPASKR